MKWGVFVLFCYGLDIYVEAAKSTLKVAACDPGLTPFVQMRNGSVKGYDIGKYLNFPKRKILDFNTVRPVRLTSCRYMEQRL